MGKFSASGPRSAAGLMLAAAAVVALAGVAHAADGTWSLLNAGSASGAWSDSATTNWSGDIVASGSGFTADFSKVNLTTSSTITLGGPRTIGNLLFGDADTTGSTAASWTLAGGTSGYVLTLAGGTPTVTVNALQTNSLVTITAAIDGTEGLTKSGVGILALSGANTYSGGTSISTGTLRAVSSSALGTGSVTVTSGAKLQLQNNITLSNAINLNGSAALELSTGNNILSGTVTLQSASTIAMGSTSNASIEISGALSLGTNTLTVSGSRPLTLSGAVSGSGNMSLSAGDGSLTILSNNNTGYSGQVQLGRSNLAIGNDGALGTGTLRMGVNDQFSGIRSTSTAARTIGNAFSVTGSLNSRYGFGSSTAGVNGDLTFTNSTLINLAGNNNIAVKFEVYNRTQFDAGFTGNNKGITMQTGTGTLVLTGASNYTGATTVNAGTLRLHGGSLTSNVTVNAGTLDGTGGSTTGSITIGNSTGTADAVLSPGESIGTLTAGGLLTINSDGVLKAELDTTALNADRIVANGVTLAAGATLDLSDLNPAMLSSVRHFTLIENTSLNPVNGTFAGGYGEGASLSVGGNNYTLSYVGGTDGNDVVLTSVIPEPAAITMALGLATGLLAMRRRRA